MIYYKLTNQDGYTRRGEKGETKWKPGVWQKPLSGRGTLCGPGWYHFYYSPDLSVLLNPIHADIKNPILWKTECRGKSQDDNGLKIGWTEARVIKQIPLPEWTITQKVAFAILCSLKVEQSEEYVKWAKDWLSGKDRTKETAADVAWVAWVAKAAVKENKLLDFSKIIKKAKKIV